MSATERMPIRSRSRLDHTMTTATTQFEQHGSDGDRQQPLTRKGEPHARLAKGSKVWRGSPKPCDRIFGVAPREAIRNRRIRRVAVVRRSDGSRHKNGRAILLGGD